MKRINNKGFVLAETLVVTVFLMVIFGMIYSNFFPLIGEYEKRESYDDVDSKYGAYWLKKIVEDSNYQPSAAKKENLKRYGFMRFECEDVDSSDLRNICQLLTSNLQGSNCDIEGNGCDIFITRYQIGGSVTPSFKEVVKNKIKKYEENCSGGNCENSYVNLCVHNDKRDVGVGIKRDDCQKKANSKIFASSYADYIFSLPDYRTASKNGAKYRVIASFYHTIDYNYYSYATIEVNR